MRYRQRQSRYITTVLISSDISLTSQDPGQFLVSKLSLRTNKDYSNPAIYGTITGEGFKASTEPMRDGGIDFGSASASAAAKKKEDPTKKGKKDEKEVKAPVKEETKTKAVAKGEKEPQPKAAKAEPEAAEPVSCLRFFPR